MLCTYVPYARENFSYAVIKKAHNSIHDVLNIMQYMILLLLEICIFLPLVKKNTKFGIKSALFSLSRDSQFLHQHRQVLR